MNSRYFTKSRFQLAMECPTKLYYSGKKEYANLKSEDSFLKALADGGFQVGALAKCYYPDGIDLSEMDVDTGISQTLDLLVNNNNVTIFEAAIRYQDLFARIDILVNNGDHLTIIEVKSTSIDTNEKNSFVGRNGIRSEWKKYIYDVAFQKHVLLKAFPGKTISSYLMLLDKNAICQVAGLNQKFRIAKEPNGMTKIIVSDNVVENDIDNKILTKINVDAEVGMVFSERFREERTFSQYVDYLSSQYKIGLKIKPVPGKVCKSCEFKVGVDIGSTKLKSGFEECWKEACGFKDEDFTVSTVLDIWNFRKTDDLIQSGIIKMDQVNENDISPKSDGKPGWSQSERQWLQVEKAKRRDNEIAVDIENLKSEMLGWTYPLHFIDFETSMCAIPLNAGERPYQGLAFQFSHHILYEDGTVEHAGQFIFEKAGENPNIEFIRALKSNLEKDNGTIFRYATHENTYLNTIYEYIKNSKDNIADKDELIEFIKTVSKSKADSVEKWEGSRSMVDLCDLVKRFYYDPKTKGSNSIKQVFPAILSRSAFLQTKYGSPIYGANGGISSLNFKDWQWIQAHDNKIVDPYNLLPKLFDDIDSSEEQVERLFDGADIKGGGAASTAYARMQFSDMSFSERKELTRALLMYCELDTLAMVMIVEAWQDMILG